MAESLAKKKKVRGGHKGYTTKILTKVKELVDSKEEKPNELKLKEYDIVLKEKLSAISKLDDEILELIEDTNIDVEIEEAEKFKEKIYEAIVSVENALKKSEKVSNQQENVVKVQKSEDSSVLQGNNIKLPKLVIKRFSGRPCDWQPFWDSYENSVHSNKQLANVDKFCYLRSLIEGPPYSTIAGLALTDSNYEVAVKLLKERFGNRQLIINSHMDALLNVSGVTSSSNIKNVRTLYDTVEQHCRGLDALGVSSDSYGALLIPMLLRKIPEDMRLLVSRKVDGKEGLSLNFLLETFKREIEARERCAASDSHRESEQKTAHRANVLNRGAISKGSLASSSALFSADKTDKRRPANCIFCRGNHSFSECKIVTNLDDRKNALKKQGRCFRCTLKGHLSRQCDKLIKCHHCSGNHHLAVCEQRFRKLTLNVSGNSPKETVMSNKEAAETPAETENSDGNSVKVTTAHVNSGLGTTQVFLQTAVTRVSKTGLIDGQNVLARIIFDTASQRSYVSSKITNKLNLNKIKTERVKISTFGEKTEEIKDCDLVELFVINPYTNFKLKMNVLSVSKICNKLQAQDLQYARERYSHLADIKFADECPPDAEIEVDILVGGDYLWQFMLDERKRGEGGTVSPVAVLTKIGWVLSGPMEVENHPKKFSSVNSVSTHILRTQTEVTEEALLSKQLERFWELDAVGIKEKDSTHEAFLKNLEFKDGRYSVNLPFKEHHDMLPDNYETALVRLNSNLKRLRSQPEVLKQYDEVINDQLKAGIVERVEPAEISEVGKTHYIPHHAVIRKNALSTKLRVVFDASSRPDKNSPSLNDCLKVGPPLTPTIFEILIRFRENKIGLVSDIEKAFLNISVDPEDRNCLRFLWVDSVDKENPELVVLRQARVMFGVNSSPFLLNGTLHHHIRRNELNDEEFREKLLRSFYVDDLTSGSTDVNSAFLLYQKAKQCLASGGFHLRKWISNSKELMELIHADTMKDENQEPKVNHNDFLQEGLSYAKLTVGGLEELSDHDEHKVLGLNWNITHDTFIFKLFLLSEFAKELKPTKRNILRVKAKLFDLMGILSPFIVLMKILFQEICLGRYGWDTLLPPHLEQLWRKWLTDLEKVRVIIVPRCIYHGISEQIVSYSLHTYGDASLKAYCAAIYIVIQTAISSYVHLLSSKTRVAPLKKQTIPRLELLSALIAARLFTSVKEALEPSITFEASYFWLDSITALYWIKSKGEMKQFVQNRVDEILDLTGREQWFHCKGTENPADLGTRGILPSQLEENSLWFQGPSWLSEGQKNWPLRELSQLQPTEES